MLLCSVLDTQEHELGACIGSTSAAHNLHNWNLKTKVFQINEMVKIDSWL
jgi:hypothetical protein